MIIIIKIIHKTLLHGLLESILHVTTNVQPIRPLVFRRTDLQEGYIHRYNLPELKPGYYISAMDTYIDYYKQIDNHKQVMV